MKNKLIIIMKMMLIIFTFWIVSIILRLGPSVIVGLLDTCCMDFDVSSEFRQHIFLFVSYGVCDFIAILISLGIFNRKRNINSKLFMFIFVIVLIIYNGTYYKDIYYSDDLVLLGNLNIYLIMINLLFLMINSILIRKKLLKR